VKNPSFALITKLEHTALGLPKGAYITVEPGTLSVAFEGFDSPDQAYALANALAGLAQQCRTIAQRLNVRTAIKDEIAFSNGDRLLTKKQALQMIGCEQSWLYKNAEKYGFLVNLGTRSKRYSEKKILEWIERGGHV